MWTHSSWYVNLTSSQKIVYLTLGVAHGADVLLVTSPELPGLPLIDPETSLGKRTTQLNLLKEEDRTTLTDLVKDTDVFLQAYRPGGLAKKGLDP